MLRASTDNSNGTVSTSSGKTPEASSFFTKPSETASSNISKADTEILYENLNELHTAYKYVTPIIDDIVCQATSYTQAEFEKILENNSAICSISLSEYSKAIRASEIISKVTSELELNRDFNYLSLQQAVINTVYTYSMDELAKGIVNIADRVYIDRDLMKKLMDLHELITETIKRVNMEMEEMPTKNYNTESVPLDGPSIKVDVSPEFAAVQTDNTETVYLNKSALNTFTVEPAKSIRINQPVNKTLTVIATGDDVLQNDSVTIINREVISSARTSEVNVTYISKHVSVDKISNDDELKEKQSDINELILPAEEVDSIEKITDDPLPPIMPPSPKNTSSSPSVDVLIDKEIEPYLEDIDIISNTDLVSEAEEAKSGELIQNELMYPPYDAAPPKKTSNDSILRKLFYELSLSVNCLKKKCVLCTSHPNLQTCGKALESRSISDNTVNLPKSFAEFKEEDALNTQQEIIKYLKELYDIKKVLNRIDNPELVVDTSVKNKQQCCTLHAYPHIHAKLNGVPVIIKMTQDTIDVLLAESYIIKENKCGCSTKALNDKVVLTSNNDKSMNAFLSQDLYNSGLNDSICSLPYVVTKRSLPNIKNSVCNPEVDSFKSNMTSQIISFQNEMIKQQLLAVGVDNLVNIATPAKCCRKPFIDEVTEDDPYRASLNSLPLTNSDMLTIKHLVDSDRKCMNTYSLQSKFAYYTNFQENFASNIEYFISKPQVIEVRFFEIFKFEEKDKKSKTNRMNPNNNHWNIFEIVRKFTTPVTRTNANKQEAANVCHETRRVRNQRSQTEESKSDRIYKSSINSLSHKPKRKKLVRDLCKSQKDSCVMCNMGDTSSLSPKNYADTLSGIYEIGSDGKVRSKPRENSTRSTTTVSSQKPSQNLGTIYEFDEKNNNPQRDKNKEMDSIYSMLNKLELTESYQKFITSDGAMKAFEKSNLGPEQFWNLYFETKKCNKAINCRKSASSMESANQNFLIPQQKIYLKRKKSRIPKRIKKTNKNDSSNSYSTNNSIKYKIKLKQTESKIAISEGSNESLENNKIASISEGIKETKTKIFFTDALEEAPCHHFLPDSIQSLRVLASKNGPGYITVLHPICGCPEVSIFIPCYCNDSNNSEFKKPSLTSNTVETLNGNNDGRHIILPKSCRINGYKGCNCSTQENNTN